MILNKNVLILFALAFVPMLQSFLTKLEFSNDVLFLKYIDELALLSLLMPAMIGFQKLRRDKQWIWMLVFFSGYLLIAFIASVINGISILQVVNQIVISLKLLYILCVFLGLRNGCILLEKYVRLAKVILILSLIFICWQFVSPGSYDAVFSAGYHRAAMLASGGVRISRGAGVFAHPGQMAVFAGSLTIILFYRHLQTGGLVFDSNIIWLLMSAIALILTFSRLEIAATCVGLLGSHLLVSKGKNLILRYAVWLSFVGVLAVIISPAIMFIYAQVGGEDVASSGDPRVVFLVKGIEIATDYFPFGSGLGSYGGFVAANYDSSVYIDYGFQQYYWYRKGIYLADTFWPHILGESGYFGLACYLISIVVIVRIAIKHAKGSISGYGAVPRMVIASTFLIGLNSLTSPDLVSVLSLSQCLIPIACMRFQSTPHANGVRLPIARSE